MELLYVWIENYKCIHKMGYHFSNKFQFNYENNQITCKREEGLKNSFWGKNISNVSVIVGDNGVGKTTLLNCIMECLAYEGDYTDISSIHAFYDFKFHIIKFYVTGRFARKLKVIHNDEGLMDNQVYPYLYMLPLGDEHCYGCRMPELKSNRIIYLHNTLDFNDYFYKKSGQLNDYSIGGLIRGDFDRNIENHHRKTDSNLVINFFNNDVYRQLEFVSNNNLTIPSEVIPFDLPKSLKVLFVQNNFVIDRITNDLITGFRLDQNSFSMESDLPNPAESLKELVRHMRKHVKDRNLTDKKELWYSLLIENLYLNALQSAAVSPTIPNGRKKEILCFLESWRSINKKLDLLSLGQKVLENAYQNLKRQESLYADNILPYIDFIAWTRRNYNNINFDFTEISRASYSPTFTVHFKGSEKNIFYEFFEHYKKTCTPFYYLNFSWGLSSGEYNLLSIYARLYSSLKVVDGERIPQLFNNNSWGETKCDSVLLLIDEADISFHPEWQSKYIASLLKFLPEIYKDMLVQVILTTHSPILLSDIPKCNVIFLNAKDKKNILPSETFGQNIYTLFQNSFVLEKPIGAFAEYKIMEWNNRLDSLINAAYKTDQLDTNNFNLEEIRQEIALVGEPIIRTMLEAKLTKLKKLCNEVVLSNRVKSIMNQYDELTEAERRQIMEHIISQEEQI